VNEVLRTCRLLAVPDHHIICIVYSSNPLSCTFLTLFNHTPLPPNMGTLGTIPPFVHSQLFVHPPYPKYSFEGQTAIVTGSNVGLGLEAAKHLARLGAAKVILAVRTPAKGEMAKRQIESLTHCTGVCEVWPLDMSSYESVKAFAKRAEGLERLDVVIENAGIQPLEFELKEGHESAVTVNVLSTFLLANLLLPTLRESSRRTGTVPRLTVVTSDTHRWEDLAKVRKEKTLLGGLNMKQNFKWSAR